MRVLYKVDYANYQVVIMYAVNVDVFFALIKCSLKPETVHAASTGF